jgi:hypothetical protein
MLAHTLKNILELVPEALPLVKQASVDQELPVDSKDSTIATALQLKYFEKLAYQSVDLDAFEKVANAVKAYGVADEVEHLTNLMVKAAKDKSTAQDRDSNDTYLMKVAMFEGSLGTMATVERGEKAVELYKEAKDRNLNTSDDVLLYSGNAFLSKEAAVKALSVRYDLTKNTDLVKIAKQLASTEMTPNQSRALAETIDCMDKIAGLHFKGHNFYKEAFFVKEAAYKGSINVRLSGKDVPYESIERVGRTKIASYLGEDVAKEMDSGPMNFKNVVETLPMDMQHVLSSLVKNV